MDKKKQSPRDMSHKGGQQSQRGQHAKSDPAMPMQQGQMAPPAKGGQPTHTGNK